MKSKTKVEKQSQRKNNEVLVETLRAAKRTGNEFWMQIASILSGPRRQKIAVNLDGVEKTTKEGDIIVVPGKVLSQGDLTKKVAIVAFTFSERAKEKLLKTKSQALTILEEIKKNPQAKGLRMVGK